MTRAQKRSIKKSSATVTAPSYRKTVLPNGVRILTELHPHSRAVSCGLWVTRGTRDELPNETGLAHFVEHLVFKRTKRRSAFQIAREMEAVGGDLNAFTSRESTCFVTHSLKDHVGLSMDVLADLVCRPSFDPTDIRKEKSVVLQEIHMSEDQLEEYIFDRYLELAFAGSRLGVPILGTAKSIQEMPRKTIVDFHQRLYTAENLIVTAAGHVSHDHVLDLVMKYVKFPKATSKRGRAEAKEIKRIAPEPKAFREAVRKPSEQVHILIGVPSSSFTDRLRFESYIVNTFLGGGMTSRLFQSIREEKGLAYSIYSQLSAFSDAGLNLVYAGTEPKKAPTVVEMILKELKKLKREGMRKSDLELFKTQVLGQILLGADDVESRMNSLGVNEMVFGKYRSVDDVMHDVQKISMDSIHEYIEMYTDLDKLGILLMGPLPEEATRKWLQQL